MNSQSTRHVPPTMHIGHTYRQLIAGTTAIILTGMLLVGVSHAEPSQAPAPVAQQKHERADGKHKRGGPEQAEKRLERMLSRLVPDATAEQKDKLKAIAQANFEQLRPLHEKSREARVQRMKLLSADKIDRQALEQARAAEQQLADQRSRITTKAFADAAEVLTPAQRAKAAEQLKKHRGPFGFHGKHHGSGHKHGERKPAPQQPAAQP